MEKAGYARPFTNECKEQKMRSKAVMTLAALSLLLCAVSGPLFAGTLAWNDCVKEAKNGNRDIKSASEKLRQAEFAKMVADSQLWPSASVSGSYGNNLSNTSSLSYNLGASYNIFDGFSAANNMAQAAEQLNYAKMIYASASSDLRQKLKNAYIDVMKTQYQLRLFKQIEERRKQSAEMIKLRYEGGNEHKGSWLLAEANYTQAKYDVVSSVRGLEYASKNLSALLGREKEEVIAVVEEFQLITDIAVSPEMKTLAAKTPSVLAASSLAKSNEYALQQSYSSSYPSLSMSGSYGGSAQNGGNINSQFSLGLSASLTIFDGFRAKNNSDKASSALKQARIDLDNTFVNTELSLRSTWMSLLNGYDQTDSQMKFYEANNERTKIADAQYSQGLISFDTWTQIEDQLINAEKSYLNSRATALKAEAAWMNVLGMTLEDIAGKDVKGGQ